MLRGGGVCIVEPQGSSFPGVSPRIRALQDRLLDSLPADGAWECLSPAQREAIISLHRARITKNLVEKSPDKRCKNIPNTNGLNRYGRSRSYEDKLESETDDSGVRLMSGETNSSSTSNSQNSQEDDSSDPGVKRGGRFTKSPRVDRLWRKEIKNPYDPSCNVRKSGVTNGIGNVNKMISKQLNRTSPQHPPSNITLDCRNVVSDYRRSRIRQENFVDPKLSSESSNQHRSRLEMESSHQPPRQDRISRKNILQRYQDSLPKPSSAVKDSTSSEDCDSGVNFKSSNEFSHRNSNVTKCNFDFDTERLVRSDESSPTSFGDMGSHSWQHESRLFNSRSTDRLLDNDLNRGHFSLDSSYLNRRGRVPEIEMHSLHSSNITSKSQQIKKLSTSYDYRTALNQEGFNKYSNNWKNIVVKREFVYQKHDSRRPMRMEHQSMDRRQPYSMDRNVSRKYIRSKSLDRKYLDDSSDDDSDFEVRRQSERMRRYAKGNQDWEAPKQKFNQQDTQQRHGCKRESSPPKTKAKSDWDLTAETLERKRYKNEDEDPFFRSRSKILNKWKSEDADLALDAEESRRRRTEQEKLRWRRRSCDFELDASDSGETAFQKDRIKQWQRRSCDFELNFNAEEVVIPPIQRSSKPENDFWDDDVNKELKLVQRRQKATRHQDLTFTKSSPPAIVKEPLTRNFLYRKDARDFTLRRDGLSRKVYPVDPVRPSPPIEIPDTSSNIMKHNSDKFRFALKPEICGRKWIRAEDIPGPKYPAYPTPYPDPSSKTGKSRAPQAFRGKLRLFKSLLSF